MLEYIKTLLQEKETASAVFKRNLVKEYLQVLVLSFLYSHKEYRMLIFYGGSSLRYFILLSKELRYIDQKIHKLIESEYENVSKMLNGLIKSLNKD